jgi:hypothetical protein
MESSGGAAMFDRRTLASAIELVPILEVTG